MWITDSYGVLLSYTGWFVFPSSCSLCEQSLCHGWTSPDERRFYTWWRCWWNDTYIKVIDPMNLLAIVMKVSWARRCVHMSAYLRARGSRVGTWMGRVERGIGSWQFCMLTIFSFLGWNLSLTENRMLNDTLICINLNHWHETILHHIASHSGSDNNNRNRDVCNWNGYLWSMAITEANLLLPPVVLISTGLAWQEM